ncbi:MAG: hypothetical protein ACPGVU_12935 [Limisphaerales bacterium]
MNRRFAFWVDPLFVIAMILFAINQLLLKPLTHVPFFQYHFNDLLLIPCALPILLWIHRQLGWRDDSPPTATEIGGHLLLWCVLFEAAGPHLMQHATGDWRDVVAYVVGGILSGLIWNHRRPQLVPVAP